MNLTAQCFLMRVRPPPKFYEPESQKNYEPKPPQIFVNLRHQKHMSMMPQNLMNLRAHNFYKHKTPKKLLTSKFWWTYGPNTFLNLSHPHIFCEHKPLKCFLGGPSFSSTSYKWILLFAFAAFAPPCVLEPLWPFLHFARLSLCGFSAFVAVSALCVLKPLWPFMHFVCLSPCGFLHTLCVLEPLWLFMRFACVSLCGRLCTLRAWAFVAFYALCVLEPSLLLGLCGRLYTLCAWAFLAFRSLSPLYALCVLAPFAFAFAFAAFACFCYFCCFLLICCFLAFVLHLPFFLFLHLFRSCSCSAQLRLVSFRFCWSVKARSCRATCLLQAFRFLLCQCAARFWNCHSSATQDWLMQNSRLLYQFVWTKKRFASRHIKPRKQTEMRWTTASSCNLVAGVWSAIMDCRVTLRAAQNNSCIVIAYWASRFEFLFISD